MKSSVSSSAMAFVSCRQLPTIDWQPGCVCPFTDHLAVFRLPVPPVATVAARFDSLLTPDEHNRASRYHHPADRSRFVSGRGLLRTVAGKYTQQPPNQIQLTVGINNKPELSNAPGLCVNLAHAGNWLLVAIGRHAVGVDIEMANNSFDFQQIMPSSFSPEEQHVIHTAANARQFFYESWTRKEALVKATALGITDGFCHVPALTGTHQVPAHLIGDGGAWVVQGFAVDNAHPAAIAHRPTNTRPVFYSFSDVF